jgi:hypothetical protein
MKRIRLSVSAAAILLFTGALLRAADDPTAQIAGILSGTFQGSTPGNELRLDFRAVPTDSQHLYDLFLDVSGKYLGQVVKRQGLIRLESQGKGVYVGYIPHFDATVTALSSNATRFSEVETNAACGFTLAVAGDGFSGETTVSGCTLALRGGTGKWSIDMEPGSIRLRNVASGETLRFRREGK